MAFSARSRTTRRRHVTARHSLGSVAAITVLSVNPEACADNKREPSKSNQDQIVRIGYEHEMVTDMDKRRKQPPIAGILGAVPAMIGPNRASSRLIACRSWRSSPSNDASRKGTLR